MKGLFCFPVYQTKPFAACGAVNPEKSGHVPFTLEKVDKQTVEVLSRVAALISLPPERVSAKAGRRASLL